MHLADRCESVEKAVGNVFGGDGALFAGQAVILYDVGTRGWSGNFDLPPSLPTPPAGSSLRIEFLDGRRGRIVVRSVSGNVVHFAGSGLPPAKRR
jgi:hypothetical protein